MKHLAGTTAFLAILLLSAGVSAFAGVSLNQSKASPSRVYLIAVGVNHYADHHYNADLALAVPDATAAYQAIMRQTADFSGGEGQLLLDAQATKAGIVAALNRVAGEAREGDLVIFYFAGNAGKLKDSYELFTPEGRPDVPDSEISMPLLRMLASQIPARNQLFILDACTDKDTFRAFAPDTVDQDPILRKLLDRNIVVIAPVGIEYENPSLGHGVLTAALLKGLAGEANLRGDNTVTVRELEAYLPYEAMKLEANVDAACYDQGDDFPVVSLASAAPANSRGSEQINETPPPPPPTTAPGKDYALLFATDQYDSSDLQKLSNPIADAQALADTLQTRYGFTVDVEAGLTRQAVYSKITEYKSKLTENDQLLVYFAGHGLYRPDDGLGYIAVKDSQPDSADLSVVGVEYGIVKAQLDHFACKHILLALDVCYGGVCDPQLALDPPLSPEMSLRRTLGPDAHFAALSQGPLFGLTGIADDPDSDTAITDQAYFQRVIGRRSRLLLTSGRKVSVADGEPGAHSPFAKALLAVLDEHAQQHKMLIWADLSAELRRLPQEPHTTSWDSDPDPDFVMLPR